MKKSGLADSPFFLSPPKKNENLTPPLENSPAKKERTKKYQKNKEEKSEQPSNHDTVIPRYHDTVTPRIHGVTVKLVRKAVKEFGKEAATHRFTQTEKKEIGDLIYTYKNQGIKTSENEITRIAVNFIFEDYKENGENSVLHKILEALNG
jgi:hypothetical protein